MANSDTPTKWFRGFLDSLDPAQKAKLWAGVLEARAKGSTDYEAAFTRLLSTIPEPAKSLVEKAHQDSSGRHNVKAANSGKSDCRAKLNKV